MTTTKSSAKKSAKALLENVLTSPSKVMKAINDNKKTDEILNLFAAYNINIATKFTPNLLLQDDNGVFCKLVKVTEKTKQTVKDSATKTVYFSVKGTDNYTEYQEYLFIPIPNTINAFFQSVNGKITYDKKSAKYNKK